MTFLTMFVKQTGKPRLLHPNESLWNGRLAWGQIPSLPDQELAAVICANPSRLQGPLSFLLQFGPPLPNKSTGELQVGNSENIPEDGSPEGTRSFYQAGVTSC